jgi:hypothetical protein
LCITLLNLPGLDFPTKHGTLLFYWAIFNKCVVRHEHIV